MVEPRFKFQDKFKLKPKEYVNTTEVETNVGQFLVNKFLYESVPAIQKVVGILMNQSLMVNSVPLKVVYYPNAYGW